MKLPISNRLEACAELVPPGSRVADVGCDHGYLGIRLLQSGKAEYVYASDLREQPLAQARRNAERFGTEANMRFSCSDGLDDLAAGEADCVVIAGMGGETIAGILQRAEWVRSDDVTLILQPQTSANDLRRWLGGTGFSIEFEQLLREGGFLYTVLRARFGGGTPLPPAEQYCSRALLRSASPLLPDYLDRLIRILGAAVEGLRQSSKADELAYQSEALRGLIEMRNAL